MGSSLATAGQFTGCWSKMQGKLKTLVQEGDNCSWHVFALFLIFAITGAQTIWKCNSCAWCSQIYGCCFFENML